MRGITDGATDRHGQTQAGFTGAGDFMAELIARASKTVFYKNLGMVGLCLVFLCWFAYDGFINWPARNDGVVAYMKGMTQQSPPLLDPRFRPELDAWKGWNNETAEKRD